MIDRSVRRTLTPLILGICAMWAGPVRATLGGDAGSVLSDAADLHGVVHASTLPGFDIQEITVDSGMRVREFLNRDGVVFAVTWAGPAVPNLQRLLGEHYEKYAAVLTARDHLGRYRAVRVAASGLVVEAGGHLRAYSGRAYLPELIPAAVPAAELR